MPMSPTSDKRSSLAVGGPAPRGRCVDWAAACVEDGPAVRSSRRELIVGIGAAVAIGVVSVLVSASAASPTTGVLETFAGVGDDGGTRNRLAGYRGGGAGGGGLDGVETAAVRAFRAAAGGYRRGG